VTNVAAAASRRASPIFVRQCSPAMGSGTQERRSSHPAGRPSSCPYHLASYDLPTAIRQRGSNGRAVHSAETIEHDARAWGLRVERLTYQVIGDELGMIQGGRTAGSRAPCQDDPRRSRRRREADRLRGSRRHVPPSAGGRWGRSRSWRLTLPAKRPGWTDMPRVQRTALQRDRPAAAIGVGSPGSGALRSW
jgi:hypothetical protein